MEEGPKRPSVPGNPHGGEMPCNVWCTGETHAVVILVEDYDDTGGPVDFGSLVRGNAPWFAALGWQIRHARRAEAETAQVFAALSAGPRMGAVLTTPTPEGFSHEALVECPPDFSPWVVTVAER